MDIENGVVIFQDYLKRIVTAARREAGNCFAGQEMQWEDVTAYTLGLRPWPAGTIFRE
jgi:hypothetical protein